MSEYTTIARPYAKAAFEHAQQSGQLDLWHDALKNCAVLAADPQAMAFIENPGSSDDQHASLFGLVTDSITPSGEKKAIENFIKILAGNNRLPVLPEIFSLYAELKAAFEKTINVEVRTYGPLTKEQRARLEQSLEKRLEKNIIINEVIDESLLGGAIIQAGDFVIDGSVRGKLAKLSAGLAA